jgi:TonB family protein
MGLILAGGAYSGAAQECDALPPAVEEDSVDVAPRLLNRDRVVLRLRQELSDSAFTVPRLSVITESLTFVFRLYVDSTGEMRCGSVVTSSGFEDLDRIALRVLRDARFAPGLVRGEPKNVWLAAPVTIAVRRPPR